MLVTVVPIFCIPNLVEYTGWYTSYHNYAYQIASSRCLLLTRLLLRHSDPTQRDPWVNPTSGHICLQ